MKRPQLTPDELQQLRWLLGGTLTLLSVATMFYLEIEAWALMTLTAVGAGAALVRPTLPARVPRFVHWMAFPAIVIFFAADLWLAGQVLPPTVRLDILLLFYRGITYRQRRDDLQVIVLGLFLIVIAGVLSVAPAFALHLLVFTALALGLLLVNTLAAAGGGGGDVGRDEGQVTRGDQGNLPPHWARHVSWKKLLRRVREVADWRVVVLGIGLFAGVVAVSAVLFLAIPRFQLENSLFLDRFIAKKAKTGFNETIRFGDVTEIQQDTSVALSVDVSDPAQVPATPYWRMVVLDEYRDGTFRLSPALRNAAFGRERTDVGMRGDARPQRGAAVTWTFYLESGVSRYLPLLGRFQQLRFREAQNFRLAAETLVVALRDEPVTMTAYRVEEMVTGDTLYDSVFAARWRNRENEPERVFMRRVGVGEADRAVLARVLGEATAVGGLGAGEFARRVNEWLVRQHGYSLSPQIPAGAGDPLVRWLASREAGHCELFAGSFVLLARAAGFPARVVTGFKGGTWNAYSNNFTVRNSDAHAWAELWDETIGGWRQVDPLTSAAEAAAVTGEAALARRADRSWSARFDSLRIFWYRRIVSFDQRTQAETLKAVKTAAQNSGLRLREAMARAVAGMRAWLARPWDAGRVAVTLAWMAGAAGVAWAGWNFRFEMLNFRFGRTRRKEDPVRAEAGRWLARLRANDEWRVTGDEGARVIAELQRLRFGSRETWAEPAEVFRDARRVGGEGRRGKAAMSAG